MSENLMTSSTFEVEQGFSNQHQNFPKESAGEVIQEICAITFGGDSTGATSGRPSCATSDGGDNTGAISGRPSTTSDGGYSSTGPPSSRTAGATLSYGVYDSSGGRSSCRPGCHPLPPGLGTPIIAIIHSPEFTFSGWDNSTENVDVETGHNQQRENDLEATYAAEEAEIKQREDAASPVVTHSRPISSTFLIAN